MRAIGVAAADEEIWVGVPGPASQPWCSTAFDPAGRLKPAYLARLAQVLDRADELATLPESLQAAVDRFNLDQTGTTTPESNGSDLTLPNGSSNGHALPTPEEESVVCPSARRRTRPNLEEPLRPLRPEGLLRIRGTRPGRLVAGVEINDVAQCLAGPIVA